MLAVENQKSSFAGERIANLVGKKRILVTGAAGSIGSALCGRISTLEPAALLGVDLFEDIRDWECIRKIFDSFRADVVFHAAALKDVPELECRARDAIRTNVFGTKNVADAAAEFGVHTIVLLSTDKAVRPASVMGATKRCAELIFQEAARTHKGFITVRLGNVLGTQRSVLPKLQEQIANGGPVTITHRGMTRYFLEMGDAVTVILTAAAIGTGGEVFVPDMGEPVFVTTLAEQLMSGTSQMRIEFTGVRPGEKLAEDLWDESCEDPRGNTFGLQEYRPHRRSALDLNALEQACGQADDTAAIAALRNAVPEYHPNNEGSF